MLLSGVMKKSLMVLMMMAGCLWADEPEFKPKRVVKPFKAIEDPKVVEVNESEGLVRDEELVLGVVLEGQARAYPINMLTNPTREIINDRLGGRWIAATW